LKTTITDEHAANNQDALRLLRNASSRERCDKALSED
jgi:hypothetical protein